MKEFEVFWRDLPKTVRRNLWEIRDEHNNWTFLDHELLQFNAIQITTALIFNSEADYSWFLIKWG